ncbi:porin family protein [Rufibacter immobilis]|uniref:porin family protein n=1 Tax=Rufibacter immobilis TaxID=1348778 RepID=UPI0035F08D2C
MTYKYALPFLFLGLLLSSLCGAQAPDQSRWAIGLQAGPSRTFLRGNKTAQELPADVRLTGGGFLRYRLSNVFLRAELLYENKGNKEEGSYVEYDLNQHAIGERHYTMRQRFHYLTLPLLLEVPVLAKGLHVAAGPYAGYLFGQELASQGEKLEFTSYYKKMDVGLTGGVAYYVPLSPALALKAELRHNLGLLNVTRDPDPASSIKTNATNLLLGLSYHLK